MIGNLGFSEMLVITLVVLIVFGPKRLPEVARGIGKALAQFRRAASDLRASVEREVEVTEIRNAFEGVQQIRRFPQEVLRRAIPLDEEAPPATVSVTAIPAPLPSPPPSTEPIEPAAPPSRPLAAPPPETAAPPGTPARAEPETASEAASRPAPVTGSEPS
jgi:Tat protein translocase TatB subunit